MDLMITCCGQYEFVRPSLLIDEKPIVGHARDMAFFMSHPVPVQGMILVKRPRIDIGRNLKSNGDSNNSPLHRFAENSVAALEYDDEADKLHVST